MRYKRLLSGLTLPCLLWSAGCSRMTVAERVEVTPILPPLALMEPRPEPPCRAARNRDLVGCILDLRTWGRQAEADKAALRAWRTGAEQAARPQETRQERGWWPWTRD